MFDLLMPDAIAAVANTPVLDTDAVDQMKVIGTVLFGLAVAHTFLVKKFQQWARRFEEGSIGENLLHFLGEVEVVFGVWAAILIAIWSFQFGTESAVGYLDHIDFTEPLFVFVIMCMSATRPIMLLADKGLSLAAKCLPGPRYLVRYVVLLTMGSLLGSLITEPAAMTVTALLLKRDFMDHPASARFRYATLGLLFVNVSIGGTLTHFAAPPVLMVSGPWSWDTSFMLTHIGWRAALAVALGALATALIFRGELKSIGTAWTISAPSVQSPDKLVVPAWVIASHVIFMIVVIKHAHHISFFMPVFLFFIGWCAVTKEYQDELRIRESLLVGFFLGGLVTLGNLQDWWLKPLLLELDTTSLFWGATALTAVTDNAAITYLATLVPNLSDATKYALVTGAVTGGGLTVIANAPNPAGFGILSPTFGDDGINPLGLFLGALPYTALAALLFCL